MAGFKNAEIENIRINLKCGHCESRFAGSDSQARKVKYEKKTVYCSVICRRAALSQKSKEQAIREGKKLRKGVLTGPCKKCGKMFESLTDKQYCSMNCYVTSDQYRTMQSKHWTLSDEVKAKISQALKKGKDVPCLECGKTFYQKPPGKGKTGKKFCSTICYRSFLAKRFDRWVANPQSMALPQCYDEFLDREELTCVVDGCDWKGIHLTLHMNQTHGVKAKDFKRAAGFNITTGVIAKPLAKAYRERAIVGVAVQSHEGALELAHAAVAKNPIRYKSLEGREHAMKARAIMDSLPGPERTCKGCGNRFEQKTQFGKTLYCSVVCRDKHYSKERKAKAKKRTRNSKGQFVWLDST